MTFKHIGKNILITGATGFLGSQLALELAKQGFSVIAFTRPFGGCSGSERFSRLCRVMGADPGTVRGIPVVEGDISLPGLGLGTDQYDFLKNSVSDVINCAADTSFTEKKRDILERVNIHGLSNLLDFARKGKCSAFHQVSTAYASGKVSGICREELTSPAGFTNAYEETKCRAEHIAAETCERTGIKLNIYRPGIVCGESGGGRTFRFNGLYYPLRSMHRIIESFKTDIVNKDGKRAGRAGVKMDHKNRLFLPLTIKVNENSGINIIPVDFFVKMFTRIMKDRTQGGIFHIVQKENCSATELIDYTGRYFDIDGLKTACDDVSEGPIERIFNLYNEAYLPYLEDKRKFTFENTDHLRERLPEDRFTYNRFKVCMDYALKTDWGKKL